MMTIDQLKRVLVAAKQFEVSAQAAIARIQEDHRLMMGSLYSLDGEHSRILATRYTTTSAETAAARRDSMDLTKELAKLRKSKP